MITSVLFYEDENCDVHTKTIIGTDMDNIDLLFKKHLDEVDGTFIHITYVNQDTTDIVFRTEAL